jgi:PAS domain S-box-containing protein
MEGVERRAGRSLWLRYGVAVALVLLATGIMFVLQPGFEPAPLAPFYGAVVLAAWYSGLRPALVTIALSTLAISLWAFAPFRIWALGWGEASRVITFVIVSVLIVTLSASRDRAEEALRASERRFRTMLETANEGVWLIDRETRTQYANDRMAALLGTSPDHLATRSVTDFVFAEDVPVIRQRLGETLSGQAEEFDVRLRRADGAEVLARAGSSPVRDGSGRIAGALGLFTDVTARRRAEAALARANERFALAASAVQAMIYEWDVATGKVDRSAGLLPLLGFRPDEANGDQTWWRSRIHPDDLGAIAADPLVRVTDGDRYTQEYRLRHRDGHWVTVWDQGQIVRDSAGRPVRVVGSTIDVTGWKDAENALRLLSEAGNALASSLDYEETLQRVAWLAVPALADWCIVDLRDEGGVARRVAVAHADPTQADLARSLMELKPSGTVSGPADGVMTTGESLLIDQVPGGDVEFAAPGLDHVSLLRAFGVNSVVVVPLRAGGQIHGAMTLATTEGSGRRLDADDLALSEQLARRSAVAIENARLYRDAQVAEARYRGLFEGTKDGILVFTPDGRCVDANPALAELTGDTRDEMVGAEMTLIAPGGPWVGEEWERLQRDGQWRGDFALRRRDGSRLPVESSITSVRLPMGPVFVGVLRDVSERKHFEQVQEEFLSALAHDLKNPLTTVRGQTQLQLRRLRRGEAPDTERLATAFEAIDTAAARMNRLLDELGDITRLRSGHEIELRREQTDLVALARRTAEEHDRIADRHAIRLATPEAELTGFWDGPRLERVLANLIGNAVKYSPAGGKITVRVAREESDVGQTAIFSVEDQGVGIPASDLHFVFERFRRAGNVESFAGSGIGLAGAKRIVELHGGTIAVASTEGTGSMFTVRIPVAIGDP